MAQETLLGFPAHTFPFRCGNLYWRRIARFPFLGYLRAKSRLAAVALRNAPAGAVPRTPLHPQGVCGIRKAAEPLTAALPYRCGESTTLSTISGYSKPEAVLSNNGNRSSRMLFFCDF